MSYESELERQGNIIKDTRKKTCLMAYKDKTDEELHAILNHNAVAIYSQSGLEAYQTLGESEACSELLMQRKERANYQESEDLNLVHALKYWEEHNILRREEAILNLPAATSYYGQLVVAVLEGDDELTAEEIRQWSDELTAMDDEEFQSLLEDLCDEEVIYVTDDDTYSLLSICTPDLFPTDLSAWLDYHHCYDSFLEHMAKTKQPMTERDWIEMEGSYIDKRDMATNPQKVYRNVARTYLKRFVDNGILSVTPIPNTDLNYYYFAMLGE